MAIRSLPALARGRRVPFRGTLLEVFVREGFVVLQDGRDEVVAGGIGRFWQPAGGLVRIEASEFRAFARPGYAKAAFDLRVERSGGLTLLTTETRIRATDEAARRNFGRAIGG